MDVYIIDYDEDQHGEGCRCGRCTRTHKTYGVGIFDACLSSDQRYGHEPLAVFYGGSYDEAACDARAQARERGWQVVALPEHD